MRWVFALAAVGALSAPPTADCSSPLPESPQDVQPLLIGSSAPGGVWPDAHGEDFDLQAAFDQRPTVLVFYRAHW